MQPWPRRAADPAQSYPNHPVRLITGSPGSTSDISARFVAQKLAERWGHQVVVDNRPGAGGIIGAEIAARSAPDGYTLFVGHIGTHASPQFLLAKLAYDPVRDFTPISMMTDSGIALVVNAALPAANLKEFVAHARARPGSVNYGSAGGGTSSQLSGELFNQMTGARLVHVPYKGAGFALNAVVANEVQAAFLSTTTANVQVKAGRLRALAVLSEKRFPAAPDIPSAPEAGFPGLDSSVWFGLFAPARDAESHHREGEPGGRGQPESSGSEERAARAGRGGHADDAGGVRNVRQPRNRQVGQGDQDGGNQGSVTVIRDW